MDNRQCLSKEPKRHECNGESSVSGIIYRDYDPSKDLVPVVMCLGEFWKEAHNEDKDKYVTLKRSDGTSYQIYDLEGLLYWFLHEEHCKLKIAEHDNKVIGFMIYYYFFESVLIVRGIWFRPEHRKKGFLRGLTHSVGHIACVLSQTYTGNSPKEIRNEKTRRKLLHRNDEFEVWFNDLRKGAFNNGKTN